MTSNSEHKVTQLLQAHREGDGEASGKLFAIVYKELHQMAHRQLVFRRPGRTINTTGLIHEAYLKLFDRPESNFEDRGHFFAVTATAMRQILVDHARRNKSLKRGGQVHRTTLSTSLAKEESLTLDILELDDALHKLEQFNPRLCKLVELRFFGGFSIEETAEILGVSGRTVDRDWYKAKSFLYLLLYGEDEP